MSISIRCSAAAPVDGEWLWSDGSKFVYTKCCSGEPNNYQNVPEDCLEINWTGKSVHLVAIYGTLLGSHFYGYKQYSSKTQKYSSCLLVSGFPNVIGCIDGTHIPIKVPSVNEGDYVNRKSFHSINVQVICDASQLITTVEAKWPGSVHDARIFQESSLCHKFEQGNFSSYLLGDRGYPCLPYMTTLYPEPGPQTRFNLAHSRNRAMVEMTIGILKARIQCLHGLRVSPERACDITVACVVLQNIATIKGERGPLA
ncbi:putative nuclease HARBI1 [Myxocyprinus asiaticus]|uniref:putative nuclease HARBI1 n=1 Tax=Myxocyprinus asiaticus TaxID=70543 RepID=UPI002221F42A|nr:putative nuclease HARBI1 [Myxocyprinus asiaticus]